MVTTSINPTSSKVAKPATYLRVFFQKIFSGFASLLVLLTVISPLVFSLTQVTTANAQVQPISEVQAGVKTAGAEPGLPHPLTQIDPNGGRVLFASNTYPLHPVTRTNCTAFAWQRIHDWGVDLPGYWGNAWQWADAARKAGFAVGKTPAPGSVLVLQGGDGHVAIVISVNSNGSLTLEDQAWGVPNPKGQNFRHYDVSLTSLSSRSPQFIYLPVRRPGEGKVYLVYEGRRFGIDSPTTLYQAGFNFDRVLSLMPANLVNQIPVVNENDKRADGTLVQKDGDLTVWAIYGGKKFGIPNLAVFNNSRYDWSKVIKIPAGVLNSISQNTDGILLRALYSADPNTIWLIQGGKRYAFTSEKAFLSRGFKYGQEDQIPGAMLESLPFGGFIR